MHAFWLLTAVTTTLFCLTEQRCGAAARALAALGCAASRVLSGRASDGVDRAAWAVETSRTETYNE